MYGVFIIGLLNIGCILATQIHPTEYKENLNLGGYDVKQTFSLNSDEFILIARKHNVEGPRLIYLHRDNGKFKIKYNGTSMGEAYVYRPYFFIHQDGRILVMAELAFEYVADIDFYELHNNSIKRLGSISISDLYYGSPIDEIDKVEYCNEEYRIKMSGDLVLNANDKNEEILKNSSIELVIANNNVTVQR